MFQKDSELHPPTPTSTVSTFAHMLLDYFHHFQTLQIILSQI